MSIKQTFIQDGCDMKYFLLKSLILSPLLSLLLLTSSAIADDTVATEANTDEAQSFRQQSTSPPIKKGNILNIVLDKAPTMTTERGTLVIEAFFDRNGNSVRDAGEEELKGLINCIIDEINYPLPAFIPGLDYNARYTIHCSGNGEYEPTLNQKNVLVARRGQVIEMSIPCHLLKP
ncbi:MAG: hypothetical protein JXR59_09445 [Desulfuromonadaceae bacterium]|nr:hypothetical protein [Desulfuromonadaceae bacterium]